MYSMVLMMAISTAPEAPSHGFGMGCIGSSCHGNSCVGSHMSHSSGCMGSSCHGSSCHGSSCHGSSCHGGFLGMRKMGGHGIFGGGLFKKHKGSSCHGCTGGEAHGCTGGHAAPVMEHAAPVMEHAPLMHAAPEAPCATAPLAPVHGTPVITTTPMMSPEIKTGEPKKMPAEIKTEEPKKMPTEIKKGTKAPARIELNVPENAKVTINGMNVAGTNSVRYFATRDLATDAKETYSVTVEVVQNGKTLSATENLIVKGGETTSVSISPKANELVSK
jgi:uncharacterized protein (TIGR03000 family)